MYQIEKDIPIPLKKPYRSNYPLDKMEINDSFFVKGDAKKINHVRTNITTFYNRTIKEGKVCPKFMTRRIDDGLRVWRVK